MMAASDLRGHDKGHKAYNTIKPTCVLELFTYTLLKRAQSTCQATVGGFRQLETKTGREKQNNLSLLRINHFVH